MISTAVPMAAAAAAALLLTTSPSALAEPHGLQKIARHHEDPLLAARAPAPAPTLAARVTTNQTFQSLYYASAYTNGAQPPGYQNGDSPDQTIIIGGANATDNDSPVSTCPIAFIGGAGVVGSEDDGWQSMASVVDFDTMHLPLDDGFTMPYYIERKDYTKASRIVMVFQGLPRDAWRYPNLLRYAGMCAVSNPDWNTNREDYIVTAPIIFNDKDRAAGGVTGNDVSWKGGGWAGGDLTEDPSGAKYTTFKALDALVDYYFNTTVFPNVKSVVVAGHSAGGLLNQHWAVLREWVDGQDDNMKWWIANAGSYTWPVDDRPVEDPQPAASCKSNGTACNITAACQSRKNEWPYGLNVTDSDSMNVYGRSRVVSNKTGVINDYYRRRILYSSAELDDGAGDTHCEAQYQGDSHISRAMNLKAVLQQQQASGARFANVTNATHVDEEMFVDLTTQDWIFVDGIFDARNGSTSSGSTKGGKKSGGSGSASSSSTTSGAGRVNGIATGAAAVLSMTALMVAALATLTIL